MPDGQFGPMRILVTSFPIVLLNPLITLGLPHKVGLSKFNNGLIFK